MENLRNLISELALLGEAITRDGVGAHEPALAKLASTARSLGVRPAAAGVLADPTAPEVVRERAFSVVAAALCILRRDGPLARRVAA